jgi:hypothetical protein
MLLDDEQEHLPDVEQEQGLLDFLSLCFLNICGNVLDFRTYLCPNSCNKVDQEVIRKKFDVNDIDVGERVSMCRARGMCLELLRWWDATYVVQRCNPTEVPDEVWPHFTSGYLAREGFKIFQYKEHIAKDSSRYGATGCTLEGLIDQLENVMNLDGHAANEWNEAMEHFNSSVAEDEEVGPFTMAHFPCVPGQWKIEKRELPLHFGTLEVRKFCMSGD